MLPHAPGVQMQAIPEDAVPDHSVDEDTEDPDKRLSSTTLTRTKSALKYTPNIWAFYTKTSRFWSCPASYFDD